ncbi:MAG: AIM24 family protein [Verrucomicrobiota bacterium]
MDRPTESRYTLDQFIASTAQQDRGQGLFELETPRMLEVNLDGEISMKMGAMVAYRGDVKFTREGMLDQGVGNLLKKAVSSEGASLSKAKGRGQVYLADMGKKIIILSLAGEDIIVNGNDLLAFEPAVKYEIKMMKKLGAMLSGGLFNIRLSGTGMIAFTSHYEPMTLRVEPDSPVYTDPSSTIAWSGNLEPNFKKDVSLKTFVGRGSGDSIQMEFKGTGFVVVQPYEEVVVSTAN